VNPNEQRYTALAIVLHRAIAAAILSNLIVGSWMKNAIDETAVQARAIADAIVPRKFLTILA
jgi:cytochrome b561